MKWAVIAIAVLLVWLGAGWLIGWWLGVQRERQTRPWPPEGASDE